MRGEAYSTLKCLIDPKIDIFATAFLLISSIVNLSYKVTTAFEIFCVTKNFVIKLK